MTNRFRRVELLDQSLTPAEAVVRVVATPEGLTPTTELRGRLVGPHCIFANTVEVAYPVRPQPAAAELGGLVGRAIIPEPSLWDPMSPFLYRALLELWEDGRCCDRAIVIHGLRRLQLDHSGLRVNGQPVFLRGREVRHCTEAEALDMRRQGVNLWLVPVEESSTNLWEVADRLGFFVLGRVPTGGSHALVGPLDHRASCLGWLVPELVPFDCCRGLLGLRAEQETRTLPEAVRFLVCRVDQATALTQAGVPLLVFGGGTEFAGNKGEGVFGWME